MIKSLSVVLILTFSYSCLADGINKEVSLENDPGNETQLNGNVSYCFRFTWLGPKYDKDSNIKNVSCDTFTKGEKGTPCRHPLVVSKNAKLPDTDWMWKEKPREKISCKMSSFETCVKYTYKYNAAVENITYMCSKVRIDKEHDVKNGCYSEYNDGQEIEVCLCKSPPGRKPCNHGNILQSNSWISVIFAAIIFFRWHY